MEPVADYAHQIDTLLSAGRALFPSAEPAAGAGPPADATAAPTPDGTGGLVAAAQQASARYRDVNARIAELTHSLDETVRFAAAQAIQAGIEADTIREGAHTQADALIGGSKGSDQVGALVSTMDERLEAMSDHISTTREQLRAAADQIRQLGAQISAAAAPGQPPAN